MCDDPAMTSAAYLAEIRREFAYEGLPGDWEARLEESRSPRGGEMLLEMADELGYAGTTILEAGCRRGDHAILLAERFGCDVVGIDAVDDALRSAEPGPRVRLACGDLEAIPLADRSVDHVWCRDVLEMVEDPAQVLRGFRRVLRPGGSVLLYVAYATELLEGRERERLFSALRLGPAGRARSGVEEAIASSGLDVAAARRISPEWTEALIESDLEQMRWGLLTSARLEREPDHYRELLGHEWYERMLAWARWSLYLILGKLESRLWVLRAPGA